MSQQQLTPQQIQQINMKNEKVLADLKAKIDPDHLGGLKDCAQGLIESQKASRLAQSEEKRASAILDVGICDLAIEYDTTPETVNVLLGREMEPQDDPKAPEDE